MCIQSFRNGENQLPYNLSEPLGKLSVNGKTGANASTQRAKETTDAQLVERVYVQSAVIVPVSYTHLTLPTKRIV